MPERFNNYFFFNDTATTEIYTLFLHDALPISGRHRRGRGRASRRRHSAYAWQGITRPDGRRAWAVKFSCRPLIRSRGTVRRSEEHTSELQSQSNLVCRLLLDTTNQ